MPTLTSYDAINRSPLGDVPLTEPLQMQSVVLRAKKAQKSWSALPLEVRQQKVVQAYECLISVEDQLALLISKEMGKDYRRARYEVAGTIENAEYFTQEIAQALTSESIGREAKMQYRPLGVVAVISPWNYPLAMANNLLLPALVAGNSVVLKPSEETPLVADLFIKTLNQVLPENVLQVVHGDAETGKALVSADINMVAFTGSLAAGKHIMASAASGLKRLVMELGGNDPLIVMASADIDKAVQFAVASSFENTGQMCTSTERIYVDERIADEFEHKVVAFASRYQAGAWDEKNVNIGPIVNPKQHAKVLSQLKDAHAKGAAFLLGSHHYELPFIQPTVVTGITPDMLLEQDETFGPIVAISRFNVLSEAIDRANASPYGLGAVVFGGSDANDVAEQMEAGMVAINQGAGGPGPWVGAKQSGFGFHGTAAGHRQFSQLRIISK
ncbi:aldehyde dehydrogenase [Colwellia sp. Bg11-12]|jgi:succinate-semialdehyde dehydrogenase/glutarate-semialdehyde dehydrogenase|uniref:aldehyde dehydrogenase family protein n=1 Tax=Colwellia sp. Bg11-12 TaxID=2759817 RepID=UPI0015F4FF77|nr:aldehyde dehydrogenase family protein [Colwellia sp. Bg11-12]MBA6264050.1 aldehyde dehydrogenase [Colwellia sp. Bg11-12]